jgi:hypothetical protein
MDERIKVMGSLLKRIPIQYLDKLCYIFDRLVRQVVVVIFSKLFSGPFVRYEKLLKSSSNYRLLINQSIPQNSQRFFPRTLCLLFDERKKKYEKTQLYESGGHKRCK